MAILLEISQWKRRQVVGVFESEASVIRFIEGIPFAQKTRSGTYTSYSLPFDRLPDYYEVHYNGFLYVLSRFSFDPEDGIIEFIWYAIHEWDGERAAQPAHIESDVMVDAYQIPAEEARAYIESREALFEASKSYYAAKGFAVRRMGLGSEDGEYVSAQTRPWANVEDYEILFLLDPAAVEIWERTGEFKRFLKEYRKEQEKLNGLS